MNFRTKAVLIAVVIVAMLCAGVYSFGAFKAAQTAQVHAIESVLTE